MSYLVKEALKEVLLTIFESKAFDTAYDEAENIFISFVKDIPYTEDYGLQIDFLLESCVVNFIVETVSTEEMENIRQIIFDHYKDIEIDVTGKGRVLLGEQPAFLTAEYFGFNGSGEVVFDKTAETDDHGTNNEEHYLHGDIVTGEQKAA